jgi:DNA-binding PucR family transcriptional regulator
VIVAGERTGELLLRSDRALAAELAAERLAPLSGLSAGSRRRLEKTLRVWLAEQGRLGPVAAALEIHPQTARYRLGRLRELFGRDLDDPDGRFWLELALRAEPMDAEGRPGEARERAEAGSARRTRAQAAA